MEVVVAEDSVLFREGLERLLREAGHDVVASVGDADSLVAVVRGKRPDLVIADIRMPPDLESDGALAARLLREDDPDLPVVLLSQHIELRHCRDLLGTPGFGYLLKDGVLRVDEFMSALERVAAGQTAVDPQIVRALVSDTSRAPHLRILTPRELEVLALAAQGHTNAAIAQALLLSERTAESHMGSVFSKLGLNDDKLTHRRVLAVLAYLGNSSQ